MEYFYDFEIINKQKIGEYRFGGVWALFGVEKGDSLNKYRCLNVGKSKCISDEIQVDLERLEKFILLKQSKKKYKNQFNEVIFEYKEYSTRLDFVYKDISDKYKDLIFILVYRGDNGYNVEKYFAYSTKALYWVSNGRYKHDTKVTKADMDRIKNNIDVSNVDSDLINKINTLNKALDKVYKLELIENN